MTVESDRVEAAFRAVAEERERREEQILALHREHATMRGEIAGIQSDVRNLSTNQAAARQSMEDHHVELHNQLEGLRVSMSDNSATLQSLTGAMGERDGENERQRTRRFRIFTILIGVATVVVMIAAITYS